MCRLFKWLSILYSHSLKKHKQKQVSHSRMQIKDEFQLKRESQKRLKVR